ncbi:hypothetical protein [Sphingomonas alpina]|uniref:Uncharacterized protein n=1 Tax=Sphingomonas alpina TaxID=653931 RepID=A0A7H0LD16_9SPHN|nr:hypothetical protein [Sphingomonas alpina]QNQ07569.1 hypothetical protein H3Z74_12050 [Sphingomonas alpina]
MANTSRSPAAGGFLIALGAVLGAIVGLFLEQPTAGFLIGSGSGIAIAVAIWLFDRRR